MTDAERIFETYAKYGWLLRRIICAKVDFEE